MKNIVKCIIFILLFVIMWNYVFKILWVDQTNISLFYKQPKNCYDVMYYGASNAYVQFNTTLAFDKYGFTTGFMATDSEPFGAVKYLIKETNKYQNPKLYVIDIFKVTDDLKKIEAGAIRKTTDSMKFTKNRIDAINELLTYNNTKKSEYINYYFSFLMYHNSWKKIATPTREDIGQLNTSSLYKGYNFGSERCIIKEQKSFIWNEKVETLPERNKEILLSLIDYIKSNNLNVLFLVPARTFTNMEIGRINDAINIIKDNGYNTINFNNLTDFKIDFKNDLYNSSHLNVYGATKCTMYLSDYINNHYELPNHKNEEKYSSWKSEYQRFKKDYKKLTGKNFDKLLVNY